MGPGVGVAVGTAVGAAVGAVVGAAVGAVVGAAVGAADGDTCAVIGAGEDVSVWAPEGFCWEESGELHPVKCTMAAIMPARHTLHLAAISLVFFFILLLPVLCLR